MSYVSRMCARLLVPSVVPLLASLLAALVAMTLLDVPVSMGGAPVWRELPGTLVAVGGGDWALY